MWGAYKLENSIEKVMMELIEDAKLLSYSEEFKKLNNGCERLEFIYKLLKNSRLFGQLTAKQKNIKSNEISLEHRTRGNDLYIREKKMLEALECYTQSIAFAENGSSFLAIAYANRSAVLFEGGYYNECIMDIERALQNNYEDRLKDKILKRRERAINLKTKQKHINYYTPISPIENKNSLISAATDSVEIKKNEKYGRHIVATKDIKIGDIISVEESFAHIILPESEYMHCHGCLELCYNMIPCEKCTAVYCSESCRQQAFNDTHKYECELTPLLHKYRQLFIRLTIKGLKEHERTDDGVLDEIYRSDRFKEINELAINENKIDFLNTCIRLSIMCVGYHSLIENSNFQKDFDITAIDGLLQNLIYRTHMIHTFNPFNIKKIKYTFCDIKSKRVGTAIYAFTSLFNHSCVPNCEFFHHGTAQVTRALANIKKGEQCTICYGISFSTTEISYRQRVLKKTYLFDCDCKACIEDWPRFNYLPLGRSIPRWFEEKVALNTFNDTDSNKALMKEILDDAIRLYNNLEKYEPCQNLLRLQNVITEIYTNMGCKCLDFYIN